MLGESQLVLGKWHRVSAEWYVASDRQMRAGWFRVQGEWHLVLAGLYRVLDVS